MDPLAPLAHALNERRVRYVVIGVWGANYWAHRPGVVFTTGDQDLFLPLDSDNLLRCWEVCEQAGLELRIGNELLDRPRDLWLAERVIARRGLTRAAGSSGLEVDLSLVMEGYDFEHVWQERRLFTVERVEIPVARLLHIVTSKHAAGRDKDRLFLATHREALAELLREDEG